MRQELRSRPDPSSHYPLLGAPQPIGVVFSFRCARHEREMEVEVL
jgi:hypothetical protein